MTEMTPETLRIRIRRGFLGGLAVVTDIADNGTEYIRADVAQARIEELGKALRQIARGTMRRGRNVSYGGGREGTMTRKEMMELAALAAKKETKDEPRWAKAPKVDPHNPVFLINDEQSGT